MERQTHSFIDKKGVRSFWTQEQKDLVPYNPQGPLLGPWAFTNFNQALFESVFDTFVFLLKCVFL